MTKNGTTLTYRVSQLEKQVEKIDCKVDMIMENHLPHINTQIEQLRAEIKVNSWKIAGITAVLSALLSIIGNYMLRVL